MLTRRAGLSVVIAVLLFGPTIVGLSASAQETEQPRLALKGYDPVAYFTDGQPMLGRPEFESNLDEVRYWFASREHLVLFESDPDRYAPQFAGSCAQGLAKGKKVEANPENWLISEGRLFVFYAAGGPAAFAADPHGMASAAERNWEQLKLSQPGAAISP